MNRHRVLLHADWPILCQTRFPFGPDSALTLISTTQRLTKTMLHATRTGLANPLRCAFRAHSVPKRTFVSLRLPIQTVALRRQLGRRSASGSSGARSTTTIVALALGAVGLAGGWYYYSQQKASKDGTGAGLLSKPTESDFQKVYNQIAHRLVEVDEYDDGSYGPVLLRLAWHCSGTYDKETNTGGSDGATMRFAPEKDHGANAGLQAARNFLEPVKTANPWISYSDLYILGGVAAVQEMGGPVIPWRYGRSDKDAAFVTPDGRLPDGAKGADHLRAIFHRMGFDDREIVALSGAHALGRCHTDRSGFSGPWTFSPTMVTNDYYAILLNEKWGWKKWDGPAQYEDKSTKSRMMLPTDMALVKDKAFRHHVERYAKDNDVFFKEFAEVLRKLFELGTNLQADYMTLKPVHA